MTTTSKNKKLVSRPMATQDDLGDGCIYFFTEQDSEKIVDLKNNLRVNSLYIEKGGV